MSSKKNNNREFTESSRKKQFLFEPTEFVEEMEDNSTPNHTVSNHQLIMENDEQNKLFVSQLFNEIKEYANFQILPLAQNIQPAHIELLLEKLKNC